MEIVLTLIPDFALILTGAWLKRVLNWTGATWGGVERLIYYVLLPALLFLSTATATFNFAAYGIVALAAILILVLGFVLGLSMRPLVKIPYPSFASGVQCAYRMNSFIGLALAGKLYGAEGVAMTSLMIGACVPVANLLAVSTLARGRDVSIMGELVKNPLLIATLAGTCINVLGLQLPDLFKDYLGRLSSASLGVALLGVGAVMVWRLPTHDRFFTAAMTFIKLIMLPLAAYGLAYVLGLDAFATGVLVLFTALPTATSAPVLASRMGGQGELTATMVTVSTLVAMLTLPLWVVGLAVGVDGIVMGDDGE